MPQTPTDKDKDKAKRSIARIMRLRNAGRISNEKATRLTRLTLERYLA